MNRVLSFRGIGNTLFHNKSIPAQSPTGLSHVSRITHHASRITFYALALLLLALCLPSPIHAQSPVEFTEGWLDNVTDDTSSVAWGDMDGDGDLDLAVGNAQTEGAGLSLVSNRVYENRGEGSFHEIVGALGIYTNSTRSVAWGDMDGDGDLDLAVGNVPTSDGLQWFGGENRLYENIGGGSFSEIAGALGTTTDQTLSVAWGDMDGDGDLDLAVGNYEQVNRVYENVGGGSFVEIADALGSATDSTYSVAWGDVDGDGDLDLAVGNGGVNRMYENVGGGAFVEIPDALGSATDFTKSVAWGDMDGDGDLDLAVGNYNQVNRVYRNDGGGRFIEIAGALGTATEHTESVAWGDGDGDGDLDLAVGNAGQVNRVYENAGGGAFVEITDALGSATDDTSSVAWGDVDGDGTLDLAVGNWGQANRVYENVGRVSFVELVGALGSISEWTDSVAWGDMDGDGDLDLAVDNRIYKNMGGDSFIEIVGALGSAIYGARSVAWGDVDGDSDLDLAVGNSNGVNRVYENVGGGSFVEIEGALGSATDATYSVAWGDVDGDGDLDLAVGNWGQANQVYENVGEGSFIEITSTLGNTAEDTRSVAWGDVDGDGDLDLAVGNAHWPTEQINRVYRNVDGDSFVEIAGALGSATDNTYSLAWGDMDGDGDLDLAVGNNSVQVNRVYENVGKGNFLEIPYALGSAIGDGMSIAWGDMDGDGDLDLAVDNRIYKNIGGDSFIEIVGALGSASDTTTSLAWGDMDGDGDLDLAVGNGGQVNRVYRNTRQGGQALPDNAPSLGLTVPSPYTSTADFYAASNVLDSPTIPIAYTLFDPESGQMGSVQAFYSLNGGGGWLPAVATMDTITTNLSTGHWLNRAVLTPTQAIPNTGLPLYAGLILTDSADIARVEAWLWITHTNNADLDVALRSPTGTQVPLFAAGQVDGQNFDHTRFSDNVTTTLIISGTAPYTGTYHPIGNLMDFEGETINGMWTLVITDTQANGYTGTLGAWGLRIKTPAVTHVYTWNTFASGFFGQSDNVVFRMIAYPQPATSAVAGTYKYYNNTPLYQRPYASATTFPFRVRGTQVHVYSETVQAGNEGAGALVYRWSEGAGSSLLADSNGTPFRTDQNGYLQGRGTLGLGDHLLALLPVATALSYDGVVQFGNTDAYVFITDSASLDLTTFSVGAWVKPTAIKDDWQPLVVKQGYTGGLRNYGLYVTPNSSRVHFSFQAGDCTTFMSYDGVGSMELNAWNHVMMAYDGATFKLYLNGVLDRSVDLVSTVCQSDEALQFGGGFSSDYYPQFEGFIDEVQIWNVARTAEEIQASLGLGLNGDEAGLVGYWSFNDPAIVTSSICGDESGNGHDGTLVGATWAGDYLGGYTVYHTSGTPTPTGVDAFPVTQPGVQVLTVTAQHPLILFDLNVSLEWDAHNDPLYLQQLAIDLQRASAHLYDFTNGQMALGKVTVYQNADGWASSHIAVQATNRLRPFAHIGGLLTDVVTETVTVDGQEHTLTYGPGQIRMGATWNRYGDPGQSIGEDWPLILAHELSHYLLYQYDVYLGLNENDLLVPVDTCTGSAMGDVYALANTEFITDTLHWTTACSQTLAAKTLGRTEWETLRLHYPWLISPTLANPGPSKMPFNFTTVEILSPTTAVDTLEDPTFYLNYEDGGVSSSEARAFLLRDADNVALPNPDDFEYIYDLGSPIGGQNRLLARGARPGDRLCVFDGGRAHFDCEIVTATDEELFLASDPTWQPVIQLTPVNSTTFTLQVTGLLSLTSPLRVHLFPEFGTVFTPTTLAYTDGVYTATLAFPYPVMNGHVQMWVDEPASETAPRREAIVNFSIGGNPGTSRASGIGTSRASGIGTSRASGIGTSRASGIGSLYVGEAPIVSTDGQMILYVSDAITFAEGQFYTIQAMAGLPDPPPGRTLVGQGYNLVATGFPTDTTVLTGSVSIQYLGSDVLVADADEDNLDIYFWDGADWTMLNTTLNTYFNMASASSQGTGIYALMASAKISLYGPGWNLFAYPLPTAQPVAQALLSISGTYTTVYGYAADDPSDPWKVYDVTVPQWLQSVVNDLTALEFGRGYWINVSQAITLYLSNITALSLAPEAIALASPPDTFYGRVTGNATFTPIAGMHVEARIRGTVCGRDVTQAWEDEVVYVVDVHANDSILSNCGNPGDTVAFSIAGRPMVPTAVWDNMQLNELTLAPAYPVYLPLVLRAK